MLEEVLRHLRNWFVEDIYTGEVTIQDGSIQLSFLQTGQYFRVEGSVFNDGVYQYPISTLHDETFQGAVWALRIPPAVLTLSKDIEDFCKSKEAQPSPYTSESFVGYSYSRGADGDGAPLTWQKIFSKRLKVWRKL